jgi:hypothetical protein
VVSKTMASNQSLYDRDFYAWANEQAALLRAGRFQEVDLENVAEEIESVGRSEKRELMSRLEVLLLHLLKWRYQPSHQGKSWQRTINEQRRRTVRHLNDNPSLQALLPEIMAEAYEDAIGDAENETGLDRTAFPASCPWTFEQIVVPGWLPS